MSGLHSLRRLILTENRLKTLEDLNPLAKCPQLIELSMESNPAAFDVLYRGFIVYKMKSLKLFDGKRITEDERRSSVRVEKRATERRSELQKSIQRVAER